MCGLIGYVGDRQVSPVILDGLDAWNIAATIPRCIAVAGNGEGLQVRRAEGKLPNLEKAIRLKAQDGTFGIGHTRGTIHGRRRQENAHLHLDCTGTIVVVHNGIVENYLSLKKKLTEEKHEFLTETDTEIIVHLIEKYHFANGQPLSLEQAVRRTVKKLNGVFALAGDCCG